MVMQEDRHLRQAEAHLFYVQEAFKFIRAEDRAFFKMEALLEVFGDLIDAQECLDEYEKDASAEVKVIDVGCPHCGQPAGSPCWTDIGKAPNNRYHAGRWERAEKAGS